MVLLPNTSGPVHRREPKQIMDLAAPSHKGSHCKVQTSPLAHGHVHAWIPTEKKNGHANQQPTNISITGKGMRWKTHTCGLGPHTGPIHRTMVVCHWTGIRVPSGLLRPNRSLHSQGWADTDQSRSPGENKTTKSTPTQTEDNGTSRAPK